MNKILALIALLIFGFLFGYALFVTVRVASISNILTTLVVGLFAYLSLRWLVK